MNRYFLIVLKISIASLLLFILYHFGHLDVSILFQDTHSFSFYFSLILSLSMFFVFQSFRWQLLLSAQDVRISFFQCLRLYLIGQFFSSFLPGAIGGDVSRSAYICKVAPDKKIASISTIFVDRLFGLYGLLFLAAISFLLQNGMSLETDKPAVINILGLISLFITISFPLYFAFKPFLNNEFLLKNKTFQGLQKLLKKYSISKYTLKHLLQCSILSITSSIFFIVAFLIIAVSFGDNLTFVETSLPIPYIVLSNMIPVTPGGIGIGEFTSSYLFSSMEFKSGAETMLLLRIWLFVIRIPGGILFILYNKT